MSNHRYNPEPYIQDAISQITSDIRHAANTNNPRYLADKAEDIARFAQALATITLHQYNIILDPRLADNEEYMRIVCAGYSVELSNWSAPLEVNTRIHVADKKTRNEINLRNRKVKQMQVTGYDIPTQTHELTFTLKDGTTRTATATYTTFREIAILENLRLTGQTLYPYSNFATRKASDKNTLDLHIDTRIHP